MRRAVDIRTSLEALRCGMIWFPKRQYNRDRAPTPFVRIDSRCSRAAAIGSRPDLCQNSREGGVRIGLQSRGQIDLVLALHTYPLEGKLGRIDGRGRVEAHLGADTIVRGRIQLGAERAGNDQQIPVGLEASG